MTNQDPESLQNGFEMAMRLAVACSLVGNDIEESSSTSLRIKRSGVLQSLSGAIVALRQPECIQPYPDALRKNLLGDRQAIIDCLIPIGANLGLGKIGSISYLSDLTLFAAANNFIPLKTLREQRLCEPL